MAYDLFIEQPQTGRQLTETRMTDMTDSKSTAQHRNAKPTADDRRKVFMDAYNELADSYSPMQIGFLFGLGHTQTRSELDRKLRDPKLPSHRGTTMMDALTIQMLVLLHRQGFDLAGFTFSDQGKLAQAPLRPIKRV